MADNNSGKPLDPNYIYRRKTTPPVVAPVSYQQRAAAVQDPRYAQAIGERVQATVQEQQKQLQQQQQQFQTQFAQSQQQLPSGQNLQSLLEKIRSNTATDTDVAAYQKLMSAQYQGPQGLQAGANIAALAQMARTPYALATTYGGFTPQANILAQQQALAGVPQGLSEVAKSAQALAAQAMGSEQAAATKIAAAQAQAQQLQQQATEAIKAEKASYEGQLTETQKAQIEAKKAAFDRFQRGVLITGRISRADLNLLGLNEQDVQSMYGLNPNIIGGLADQTTIGQFDKYVEDLRNKESKTTEEQNILDVYDTLRQAKEDVETSQAYGYASPQDLAKINALRALAGAPGETSALKQSDIGKGFSSGKFSKDTITSLKNLSSQYQSQSQTESEAHQSAAEAITTLRQVGFVAGGDETQSPTKIKSFLDSAASDNATLDHNAAIDHAAYNEPENADKLQQQKDAIKDKFKKQLDIIKGTDEQGKLSRQKYDIYGQIKPQDGGRSMLEIVSDLENKLKRYDDVTKTIKEQIKHATGYNKMSQEGGGLFQTAYTDLVKERDKLLTDFAYVFKHDILNPYVSAEQNVTGAQYKQAALRQLQLI